MRRLGRFGLVGLVGLGALAGAGCSSGSDAELIGTAEARITTVPAGVGCVAVVASGSQTVTRYFSVTPGQASVLPLTKLPVGTVTFSGSAFNAACTPTPDPASASWTAAPVMATVSPSSTGSVTLSFVQTGTENVSANFDDGGATVTVLDGGIGMGMTGTPTWHTVNLPASMVGANVPTAMGGSGPNDIWFVTNGQLDHWDGTAINAQLQVDPTVETLTNVWGSAAGEAWVTSATANPMAMTGGALRHSVSLGPWSKTYQGAAGVSFYGVWAQSGDIWAVGGAVIHSTDSGMSFSTISGATNPVAVWATAGASAWIGGSSLYLWNGMALIGAGGNAINAVSGTSPMDIWTIGVAGGSIQIGHENGASWSTSYTVPTMGPNPSIHATSTTDAWAVTGSDTSLLHWNGMTWSNFASLPAVTGATFKAVWATSPSDVWLATSQAGVVYHYAP